MIDALANAESALRAYQAQIDMISHNISNVNTPGYKSNSPVFSSMVTGTSPDSVTAGNKGAGVEVSSSIHRFTDGEYKFTGVPLDMAIRGAGLIEVEREDGTFAYTRAGSLSKSSDGALVTSGGLRLSSDIVIPSDITDIEISTDGRVHGISSNGSEVMDLGQIELAMFDSFESLQPLEGGLWKKTEAAGQLNFAAPGEDGAGMLLQGYVEMSNVNMIDQMVSLMSAQRAYQLNSRVIQVGDQLLETINNLRR